jgi:hypothetical protein
MAISLFYALGTGVGGLIGPALFGILVWRGKEQWKKSKNKNKGSKKKKIYEEGSSPFSCANADKKDRVRNFFAMEISRKTRNLLQKRVVT